MSVSPRSTRGGLVVVVAAALALAGCQGGEEAAAPASPLQDCAGLVVAWDEAPRKPLPAVTLPCFTGGELVALDELRGPAVVNLWASWCVPCREELPALQRYADRAGGDVRVVGVVTEDRRPAAASLAGHLDIIFPALDDPEGAVLAEVGGLGLPLTIFVDAAGEIRHLHNAPLDEAGVERYVEEHLGVVAR